MNETAIPLLERAQVEAVMVSYMNLSKSPKLRRLCHEHFHPDYHTGWVPRTYLDSGVFTFMRRAGVTYQNMQNVKQGPATWAEFRAFARTFIDYLKEEQDLWDHIVELDVDELYGVEAADAFRVQLRKLVGDRLLPVWHAQRGPEGWTQMVKDFSYVCLSPSKVFNRKARSERLIEDMLKEAHAHDCSVHILGVENERWFDLGADSFDASSWSSGVRWGQFKLTGGARHVIVPTSEKQTIRRPIKHTHILQFKDMLAEWGYRLEDVKDHDTARQIGIYLIQKRQEEGRRVRNLSQATG